MHTLPLLLKMAVMIWSIGYEPCEAQRSSPPLRAALSPADTLPPAAEPRLKQCPVAAARDAACAPLAYTDLALDDLTS